MNIIIVVITVAIDIIIAHLFLAFRVYLARGGSDDDLLMWDSLLLLQMMAVQKLNLYLTLRFFKI